MPHAPLNHGDLRTVVRLAPLVSIDLIIRNAQNQVLLGLRTNEPAKGFYFVPGGMIRKGERLHDAFARILKDETNCTARFEDAEPVGVLEHFYDTNRFGDAGYSTHYVALGYALRLTDTAGLIGDSQHSNFSEHCCPSCGRPMRFVLAVLRFSTFPELRTYECKSCGVTYTEAAKEDEPEALEQASLTPR